MLPQQITLVQRSFASARPRADQLTTGFYRHMFELDPTLRRLFPEDLASQRHKLMNMLQVLIDGLTHLETVVVTVQELGRRHAYYGVVDAHYAVVNLALRRAVADVLGAGYTPEIDQAWDQVYTILADTMKHAANSASFPA